MEPKMKFFYPKVKGIDADNRRITVCISKDEIDRHNERIEINAIADALGPWGTTNPVVLGDHQHRLSTGKSSVIGHAPPEVFKVLENEVDMDIIFSVTENAETYWINFRDGHQKAVSIGFIDLEWRLDEEDGRKVFVSTKIELLEVSCVAVGANRGALVKAKGMFDRIKESVYHCECIECGHLETSETHCKDLKCPECGGQMRRVERPGPGQNQEQRKSADEKVEKQISDLKTFIESELDEIKSLLITDLDGFAEGLLGGPSDPSAPGGDNNKAERYVKAVQNVTSKINLRKDNSYG